eukprot:NODE_23544_length_661_cov_7.810861.p3 GENE.NODE_23544_length_661_cov_7.810861~~NODE_23544_length_661_cov_7.810861.p3  ORF type:complete len:50 (+),score=6.56 NODE_23544_length_661_cov_7.810861:512-661(+)
MHVLGYRMCLLHNEEVRLRRPRDVRIINSVRSHHGAQCADHYLQRRHVV